MVSCASVRRVWYFVRYLTTVTLALLTQSNWSNLSSVGGVTRHVSIEVPDTSLFLRLLTCLGNDETCSCRHVWHRAVRQPAFFCYFFLSLTVRNVQMVISQSTCMSETSCVRSCITFSFSQVCASLGKTARPVWPVDPWWNLYQDHTCPPKIFDEGFVCNFLLLKLFFPLALTW